MLLRQRFSDHPRQWRRADHAGQDVSGELMAKLAKSDAQVVYMGREQGPFECGRCEYFSKPSACEKVKGTIDAEACCNLFEKKVEKHTVSTHGDLKWMES
jgi:hypothetical protein